MNAIEFLFLTFDKELPSQNHQHARRTYVSTVVHFLWMLLMYIESRQRLMQDANLYPEFGGPRKSKEPSSAIVSTAL